MWRAEETLWHLCAVNFFVVLSGMRWEVYKSSGGRCTKGLCGEAQCAGGYTNVAAIFSDPDMPVALLDTSSALHFLKREH